MNTTVNTLSLLNKLLWKANKIMDFETTSVAIAALRLNFRIPSENKIGEIHHVYHCEDFTLINTHIEYGSIIGPISHKDTEVISVGTLYLQYFDYNPNYSHITLTFSIYDAGMSIVIKRVFSNIPKVLKKKYGSDMDVIKNKNYPTAHIVKCERIFETVASYNDYLFEMFEDVQTLISSDVVEHSRDPKPPSPPRNIRMARTRRTPTPSASIELFPLSRDSTVADIEENPGPEYGKVYQDCFSHQMITQCMFERECMEKRVAIINAMCEKMEDDVRKEDLVCLWVPDGSDIPTCDDYYGVKKPNYFFLVYFSSIFACFIYLGIRWFLKKFVLARNADMADIEVDPGPESVASYDTCPELIEELDPHQAELQMFDFEINIPGAAAAAENINKLCEKINKHMPDKGVADAVKELFNPTVKNIGKNIACTAGVVTAVFALDYLCSRRETSKIIAMTGAACSVAYFGPQFYERMMKMLSKPKGVELQFGEDLRDNLLDCLYNLLPKLPTKSIKEAAYYFANFDRIKGGIMSCLNYILELIDYICSKLIGTRIVPSGFFRATTDDRTVLAFVNEIDEFGLALKSNKITFNMQSFNTCRTLINACDGLSISIKPHSGAASILRSCRQELVELKKRFEALISVPGHFVKEPTMCLFSGAPGNFKSSIMAQVVLALYKNRKPENVEDVNEDLKNFVYNRDPATGFFDGYVNQTVFRADDLFQAKDIAGVPDNEFMTIIRAKNTVPYMVHMASLEAKGNTYFTSDFILATSNACEFLPASIIEPGAIRRRFDIHCILVPKAKYAVDPHAALMERVFDMNTLPQKDKVFDLKPEHCEFWLKGKCDPSEKAEKAFNILLTFDDLIALLEEKNTLYKRIFDKMKRDTHNVCTPVELNVEFKKWVEDEKYFEYYSVFLRELYERCEGYLDSDFGVTNKLINEFGLPDVQRMVLDMDPISMIMAAEFLVPPIKGDFKHLEMSEFSVVDKETKTIFDTIKDNKYMILTAATVGTLLFTFMSSQKETGELQSPNQTLKTSTAPKSLKDLKSHLGTLQMKKSVDPNNADLIDSIMRKNMYSMYFGEDNRNAGHVLFINGNLMVCPSHFLYTILQYCVEGRHGVTPDSPLKFVGNRKEKGVYKVPVSEFLESCIPNDEGELNDIAFVAIKTTFPSHKDISSYFKSERQMKDVFECVRISAMTWNGKEADIESQLSRAVKAHNYNVVWVDGSIRTLGSVYHMKASTDKGDCGAIMSEMNSSTREKLCGIHVCGNPDLVRATSGIITREMIDKAMQSTDRIVVNEFLNNALEGDLQMGGPLDDQFSFFGKVPIGYSSQKSELARSKMYGLFGPPKLAPSLLHPIKRNGEQIDPLIKGVRKYNIDPAVFVDPVTLKEVIDSEIDFYNKNSPFHTEMRLLTDEEVVKGIKDDPTIGPVNVQSSCGYPLKRPGFKGKEELFGKDGAYDMTTPAFLRFLVLIEEMEEKLARGVLPEFLFTDNLKDELRKLIKIITGDTRVFSCIPFTLFYLFKKYFGAASGWFVKNRLYNGISIGINPYGSEWHVLGTMLTEMSKYIIAGDFSGFDTKQIAQVIHEIQHIFHFLYPNATRAERRIREVLWITTHQSLHIVNGDVYLWDFGLGSGHYMTALLNSIYCRVLHKFCFVKLHPKIVSPCVRFDQVVKLVTYGDDSIGAVKEEFIETYNETTIAKIMKEELGQVYTSDDKTSIRTTRPLSECNFLKRGFRYSSVINGFTAPMDLDRVLEMVNWTRVHNGDEILRNKINIILRELSLHGRMIFTKYACILNDAFKKEFGEGVDSMSYITTLELVLNSVPETFIGNLQMGFRPETTKKALKNTMISTITNIDVRQCQINDESLVISKPFYPPGILQMGDTSTSTSFTDPEIKIASAPLSIRKPGLLKDSNPGSVRTIESYLAIPTVVAHGVFANGDTASTFPIYNWEIPAQTAIHYDKIKGIYTLRADLKLRVVWNATPLQAGRYKLCWMPMGGLYDATAVSQYTYMHRFSKVQTTQLPGIEFDLNTGASVELTIPWVSAFNGWPIHATSGYASPGRFFIVPLVTLTSASGSTTCDYTLWASYENVALGEVGYLQMGGKPDLTTKEQHAPKPISDALKIGYDVSHALSDVPLLSAIATPVSWLFDAFHKSAVSWGFSKPNLVTPVMRVNTDTMNYLANADGENVGEMLAVTKGNYVDIGNNYTSSDVDEMSFKFLTQINCWTNVFTWADSQAYGTVLYSSSVGPVDGIDNVSDGAVTLINYTPLGYLASIHNVWRGSLVYTFKFVMTGYQKGRVVICFEPYVDGLWTPGVDDVVKSAYLIREIVEVGTIREYSLTIPYVNARPWMSTKQSQGGVGRLSVIVDNALVAPAVVPSTISCAVYLRGGPDFQFASPSASTATPCVPGALQMGDEPALELESILGPGSPTETYEAQAICHGEVITSLRQLMKRFSLMSGIAITGSLTDKGLILPFATYVYTSNSAVVAGSNLDVTRDLYGIFSSFYAFGRGGCRICFFPTGGGTTGNYVVSLDHVNAGAAPRTQAISMISTASRLNVLCSYTTASVGYWTASQGGKIYTIPQGTTAFSRVNAVNQMSSTNTYSYTLTETDPAQLHVSMSGSASNDLHILRSAADDGGFSQFVSIPPFYAGSVPA